MCMWCNGRNIERSVQFITLNPCPFCWASVRNPIVHQSSEHLYTSCDKTMESNPNCKGNHERLLSDIYFPIKTYITKQQTNKGNFDYLSYDKFKIVSILILLDCDKEVQIGLLIITVLKHRQVNQRIQPGHCSC